VGGSFSQYCNVIIRLDSVWVGMDLVTVTVIGVDREEGMATFIQYSRHRAEDMI